jgi:hypothetical protein
MAFQFASLVLAQFAANLELVTSDASDETFKASGYRLALGKEPDSAVDGVYFIDITSIPKVAPTFGNTETIFEATIAVELGYYRGGGDLDEGDRQSVMRNAASDAQRVADVLSNPAYYAGSVTGIREVRFIGAERIIDKHRAEVWAVRFWVQWRSDLVTAIGGPAAIFVPPDTTAFWASYSPAQPGDWATSPPITIAEALDRLAAAVPGI